MILARVVLVLMCASCWAPQRIVGTELSLDAYRAAVRCVDPGQKEACIVRAWELDQLVAKNLDCVTDDDCVAIAGVEPNEVDRMAVNRRISEDVIRAWRDLTSIAACGDYDWFGRSDMRTTCKAGRCELVLPARSAIVVEGCVTGRKNGK